MDGASDNGDNRDQGGSHWILAKFQSQVYAMANSQATNGEAPHLLLGDVFPLTLGPLKAVACHLKQCQDAKYAAQGGVSLAEEDGEELNEFLLSLKGRVRKLLVFKESFRADLIETGVE